MQGAQLQARQTRRQRLSVVRTNAAATVEAPARPTTKGPTSSAPSDKATQKPTVRASLADHRGKDYLSRP